MIFRRPGSLKIACRTVYCRQMHNVRVWTGESFFLRQRRLAMKGRTGRVCLGFSMLAVCVAGMFSAFPVSAQGGETPVADRAELRADLLYLVNSYKDMVSAGQVDAGLEAALASAERELELSAEEAFAPAEMLAPIVRQMRLRLDDMKALVYAEGKASHLLAKSDGLPSADYPNINSMEFVITILRSDLPRVISFLGAFLIPAIPQTVEAVIPFYCVGDPDGDGIANRKDDLLVLTSQNLLASAEALREAASRICEQDLTIVGEGGNLSVVCIVSDVLFVAAKTVHANMLLCEGFIDSAETAATYRRVGHLHEDLINVDSDLATHHAIVNGKLDATTNSINIVQDTLDTTVELRRIHIQVLELKE